VSSIALYGGADLRYTNFLSAYVYTLHAQIALSPHLATEEWSVMSLLFHVMNNFMVYFLNILLGSITIAFMKGALTLELLTVDDGTGP